MDDKEGHEQCVAFGKEVREQCVAYGKEAHEQWAAFGKNLGRMKEVLQALHDTKVTTESLAVAAEVKNLMNGFRILRKTNADQLVKKVQEVKVLQEEKQILESKLEQLASVVSSMVSGKAAVLKDASNVDLTTTTKSEGQVKNQGKFKDGQVQMNHLKCEEEFVKRELDLTKLREAYASTNLDLEKCRKEVHRLEIRLKSAKDRAATEGKDRQELLKAQTAEIANLKDDIVRLKEETTQLRTEAGRLEEQVGRATLKNEQFVELLKKDSKHQDELRRQQKTLKGYLQLLASKFTSTHETEDLDLEFELRGLECRGLDDDTTTYLKKILERGFKPAKCSVETQTMLNDVSQSSSSTHTRYSTATEGTRTLSGNPSILLPVVSTLTEDIDVLDDQWNLNFDPDVGEIKAPENMGEKDHEVIKCPESTEEPWREHSREKSLDHTGLKRPIEVIDLDSDTDDESEKRHDIFRHKYRQLSRGLERVADALDINIPLCEPSSTEEHVQKREGLPVGLLPTREEFATRKGSDVSYL